MYSSTVRPDNYMRKQILRLALNMSFLCHVEDHLPPPPPQHIECTRLHVSRTSTIMPWIRRWFPIWSTLLCQRTGVQRRLYLPVAVATCFIDAATVNAVTSLDVSLLVLFVERSNDRPKESWGESYRRHSHCPIMCFQSYTSDAYLQRNEIRWKYIWMLR